MSRTLVVTAKRGLWIVALLFSIVTFLDYITGVNSSAMEFSERELRESISLRQSIGAVSDVRLRKFWGYSHKTGYGNSTARLSLVVVGDRRTQKIELSLRQVDGRWTIVESSVPL